MRNLESGVVVQVSSNIKQVNFGIMFLRHQKDVGQDVLGVSQKIGGIQNAFDLDYISFHPDLGTLSYLFFPVKNQRSNSR